MIQWPDFSPMKTSDNMQHSATPVDQQRSSRRRLRRSGIGSVEVIVAFTLLTTVLSVTLPLVVRHGRILKDQRNYRLALDELSNHLDRLTLMPVDEVPDALEQLKPSSLTADKLPGATLVGQLESADVGSRLTLSLSWGGPQRKANPITLVGWVLPTPPGTDDIKQREDAR